MVIPKGSLQFESGLSWTSDNGRATVDGIESVVRPGLTTSGELRIALPNYYRDWKTATRDGFSDILLSWKQQLTGGSGPFQLSVAPGISLPSGSNGSTNGAFSPQLGIAWSHSMNARWSTSGVQSVYYSSGNGRYFLEGETIFAIERKLSRTVESYLESQASYGHFGSTYILTVGAFYRKRPNYQWDFSFGVGMDRGAEQVSFGVGFSFRTADMANHRQACHCSRDIVRGRSD
ncbi:MAG: transporter [Acidobacteriia bacterium]|nr:transporter [Terriglobia bacterium]